MKKRLLVLLVTLGCAERTIGPPEPLAVTLAISVSARSAVAFDEGPAPSDFASVILTGDGAATTAWTATARHPWTSLTKSYGVGSGPVEWTRNTLGLTPGVHVDTITITLPEVGAPPVVVVDTLTILPPATVRTLLVSPASRRVVVPYGDLAADGSVTVTVTGEFDSRNWCVTKRQPWLTWSYAPLNSNTCANPGTLLEWHRDVTGLLPGTYVDTLTVTRSNNTLGSPAVVVDTLVIAPGPGPLTLGLTPTGKNTLINQGATGTSDVATLTLSGKNNATTVWTAANRLSSTTLSKSSGNGSATITWTRNTAALAAGIYYDTITVTAPGAAGSPLRILDTLRVKGSTPTAPITWSATALWAGGNVALRSESFRGRGVGATLRFGTVDVLLSRLDDTTMSAALPRTLSGSHTPQLQLDGYQLALPAVTIAGFTSLFTFNDPIDWNTLLWYRDGRPIVVGSTKSGYLGQFDLEQSALSKVIPADGSLRGPGPTPTDGLFLNRSNFQNNLLDAWQLTGTPTKVASYDLATMFGNTFTRALMQMSENAWFVSSGQHNYRIFKRSDPLQPLQGGDLIQAEEVEGVVLSPRKDRATFLVDGMPTAGIPVYDAATGNVAFTVGPLRSSTGAAFSRDGTLLAMVGSINGAFTALPGRIILMNATTGVVLGDTTLDRSVWAVALDPDRPLLYAAAYQPNQGPVLLVLDRNTFKVLGEMAPTELGQYGNQCCYRALVAPSPATNSVYLFFWDYAWKFSLPPK